MSFLCAKFALGGLIFIGLGLSQAIYGWISDAMFARILYGVVGTVLGLAMFFGGGFALWGTLFPSAFEPKAKEQGDD